MAPVTGICWGVTANSGTFLLGEAVSGCLWLAVPRAEKLNGTGKVGDNPSLCDPSRLNTSLCLPPCFLPRARSDWWSRIGAAGLSGGQYLTLRDSIDYRSRRQSGSQCHPVEDSRDWHLRTFRNPVSFPMECQGGWQGMHHIKWSSLEQPVFTCQWLGPLSWLLSVLMLGVNTFFLAKVCECYMREWLAINGNKCVIGYQ